MTDTRMYMTTGGEDGIWEFNPETGKRPHQLKATAKHGFHNIVQVDKFLYMTPQSGTGIWHYDLAKPEEAPIRLKPTEQHTFNGIAYLHPLLYLTKMDEPRGIWTYDLTKPHLPPVRIESTKDLGFREIIVGTAE